jgi:membrane-bound lytic murein transglycosylase A
MPQSRVIGAQIGDITAGDFRDVCEIAEVVKGMSNKQIQNFFENWFKPFSVTAKSGGSKGLFTGYYEAELRGSKIKSEKYKYPIYAKPKDLNSEPYFTRKEIDAGALKDKGLEILYVDDIADLFFLHVQGSGRVTLPNGSVVRLSFAAKNNQPYTSISNYFVENNLIPRDQISADTIKQWLRNNQEKAYEAMAINDSYIFFRISDGEYVIGSQGVALTPEHSLAVDNDIIPYGLPIWVETFFKKNGAKEKYNQLLVSQDTGSAIKGIVRGDIFFGHGKDAESKASTMASSGQYYIFLPNNAVDRIVKNVR